MESQILRPLFDSQHYLNGVEKRGVTVRNTADPRPLDSNPPTSVHTAVVPSICLRNTRLSSHQIEREITLSDTADNWERCYS